MDAFAPLRVFLAFYQFVFEMAKHKKIDDFLRNRMLQMKLSCSCLVFPVVVDDFFLLKVLNSIIYKLGKIGTEDFNYGLQEQHDLCN